MRNLAPKFICVVDLADMTDDSVPPYLPFQWASAALALDVHVSLLMLSNVLR